MHMHMHMKAYVHMYAHTHTHAYSHAYAQAHAHVHGHAHANLAILPTDHLVEVADAHMQRRVARGYRSGQQPCERPTPHNCCIPEQHGYGLHACPNILMCARHVTCAYDICICMCMRMYMQYSPRSKSHNRCVPRYSAW